MGSDDAMSNATTAAIYEMKTQAYAKVVKDGRVTVLVEAVVDAFMKAKLVPDQEVRLYFKRLEDIVVSTEQIIEMGKTLDDCVDMVATRARRDQGKAVIEFKNGSCICLLPETKP